MLEDYCLRTVFGMSSTVLAMPKRPTILVDRSTFIVLKSSSHRMPQFGGDGLGARR